MRAMRVVVLLWEIAPLIHADSIQKLADKLAEFTHAATHRPVSGFN